MQIAHIKVRIAYCAAHALYLIIGLVVIHCFLKRPMAHVALIGVGELKVFARGSTIQHFIGRHILPTHRIAECVAAIAHWLNVPPGIVGVAGVLQVIQIDSLVVLGTEHNRSLARITGTVNAI